ncbi:MAG TPA: outer membrane beta-barrel protein [Caulobacteraceae bacterium]
MKKFLFATAMAAATLAAAPAFAANGYVGVTGSHTEVDVGSSTGDANSFGLVGAGVTPLGANLGLQFDGGVVFNDSDDLSDDTAFAGGLHLYRGASNSRFGGFAGVTTSDDVTTWDVGGEGQIFLNNVVLDGAIGYFNIDDLDVDGWGGRVGASVFPNDNFSISGGFGLATADGDSVDTDGWMAGIGTEFQMSTMPVSFSANYNHSEIDDFDLEVDTVSIGVNYNFGGGTLKDRKTTGPGLGGLGLAGLFRF